MTGQPEHFDAVIVGSGFGGAVTAARLAEAGWRVCVLERGKAYPPNSFPRSPLDMKHNFWDPADGRHGMFDLWEFDGIDAVCASGLGGGSLIYANVLLRKDEHWFVNEDLAHGGYENWAVTREDLDPHYDEVERRIGIQEYPLGRSPYDQTPKVLAYRQAAENLGLDWSLVPLAVTFAGPGTAPVPGEPIAERPNLHGRSRLTCRLCGECDVGCNSGSKNTLDFTYLSDAWRAGAELRTRCEVRTFKPLDGGGYRVDYRIHSPQTEGTPTDTSALELHTVTCSHLVLSAGTMGTNWLLWRNRAELPGLSDQLGHGFSGNGDLLTFAVRAKRAAADGSQRPWVMASGYGPVITSRIRVPDAADVYPAKGSVVSARRLTVTFLLSTPLAPDGIGENAILALGSNSGEIAGTVSYLERDGLLRFSPSRDFASGETVTVTLDLAKLRGPGGRSGAGKISTSFLVPVARE